MARESLLVYKRKINNEATRKESLEIQEVLKVRTSFPKSMTLLMDLLGRNREFNGNRKV